MRCPSLYQVDTRVWLTAVRSSADERAWTTYPMRSWIVWRRSASTGCGCSASGRRAWLGSASREPIPSGGGNSRRRCQISRDEDIGGSGFAITGYTVHQALGGDAALARLRERFGSRGLRLLLDFVPNHTGLDHPWVEDHPDYYIAGTEIDLARAPAELHLGRARQGKVLLAHGRDPYFPGWPDTLQLNYGNAATQEAMIEELLKIAGQCDGVRCDMAMLVLPDVFERTWGCGRAPSGPGRSSGCVEHVPTFLFMAEAYWDLEWDAAAAGLRLHLRQAALRPPARTACSAGARPFPCRSRLPGQAGPVPGEPR